MASSNRHWPSLFKSKPNHHHQWQHDLISNGCNRLPNNYSSNSHVSGGGGEERSPEPKPRWNPKPEQIRILEAIFNSGMVNPPRDEIRKIRAQLQEYGQVGDANVFYWFQNRKSRSKNKQRHLHNHHHHHHHSTKHTSSSGVAAATAPSPSSSSSSEKSSSNAGAHAAASVNQANYFPSHGGEFLETAAAYTQGFCFSELSSVVEAPTGPCTNLLLSEIIGHGGVEGSSKKDLEVGEKMKTQQPQMMMMMTSSGALTNNHSNVAPSSTTVTVPSTINLVQGVGESGGPRSMMVFINDVAFEVGVGPFNVREAFGDDVVLINSCGQPVLTNEWGVTLHSLQHGAFYYLV